MARNFICHTMVGILDDDTAGKRRILEKMKIRLSKSTHNLNKAAFLAGGEKVYGEGSTLSISKGDGRIRSGSSIRGSELNAGDDNIPLKVLYTAKDRWKRVKTLSILPNPTFSGQVQQSSSTRGSGIGLTSLVNGRPPSSSDNARNDQWGLHPEERPNKPLEEMSLREIKEYAVQLERTCQTTRAEATRLQAENVELVKRATTAEDDLTDVRITLANLRNRLLQDNLTEYLENPADIDGGASFFNLSAKGSRARGSMRRSMSAANFSTDFVNGPQKSQQPQSTAQAFLAKLSAISMNPARKQATNRNGGFPSTTSTVVEPSNDGAVWW